MGISGLVDDSQWRYQQVCFKMRPNEVVKSPKKMVPDKMVVSECLDCTWISMVVSECLDCTWILACLCLCVLLKKCGSHSTVHKPTKVIKI